jgi:four helix bundle protein
MKSNETDKVAQTTGRIFSHEKLQVYGKALDFAVRVADWTNSWDKRHALVDHLDRAAESIMWNLAEAAWQRRAPGRLRIVDYAIGSSLECAGCLDIARIKELLTQAQANVEKRRLCEITKMLIGLRKAWAESGAREDPGPYTTASMETPLATLFHHENLDVYRAALGFMEWFAFGPMGDGLSDRMVRQIDESGTSVVLNIAEGNGRYAELDHHRFLHIANSAAVKAAVYLDLSGKQGLWTVPEIASGKAILLRVNDMLGAF